MSLESLNFQPESTPGLSGVGSSLPARLVRYMCPSILFSSSREEIVEGYTLGANSYVNKPASFDRFSEAMQYLGWYWLNLNESP